MFRNLYQRAAGGPPFLMGRWPTRAVADQMAEENVSTTLLRLDVIEEDDEDCPECEGSGVIGYYPSIYGSYDCPGPAERTCNDCYGTGVH